MNAQICLTPSSQNALFQGDDTNRTVSSSRFCINWDKVILFANSALIVAGIAIAYFMKLPLVMAGLGVYGSLYLMLKPLAERQQSLIAAEKRDELGRQVNSLEEQIAELENKKESLSWEVIVAKQKRKEPLSDAELAEINDRRVAVARGQAAVEWLKREAPKAERENPALDLKLKDLHERMRSAGRALNI